MKLMVRRLFLTMTLLPLAAGCVSADPEPAVSRDAAGIVSGSKEWSVSRTGVFGEQEIRYTARLEYLDVQPENDLPTVNIASFNYVAEGAPVDRPVLFIFNGGPISASLWLHIGALGPQRVFAPEDLSAPPEDYRLVENKYSPLDVADLVFFDPASTGFSRAGEEDAARYFSVRTDAAQFVAFAEAWLEKHDRKDAPVFVLGESYGTHRAAEVAGQISEAKRLNFGGVFLMGQAVNIIEYSQRKQNILSYVASLPTLAAIAWDLDVLDKDDRSFEEFMAEVENFGEAEYLPALFKGQRISAEDLDRLAVALEAYTGIPADYYKQNRLRISKEQFRVELLKNSGKILGRSDGRYTAPLGDGRGDPTSILQTAYQNLFAEYVSETFDGLPMADYRPIFSAGSGYDSWDWGGASPFAHYAYAERLDLAFEAYPDFRLFVGTGYHDTMTTVGAADYLIDQSDWPGDRVRKAKYIGGHMAYSVDDSARRFGDDIRSWITGWDVTGDND